MQTARTIGFLIGADVNVLVEETLLRQGAAEIQGLFLHRCRGAGRCHFQQGETDVRKEALQCDIADRCRFQKAAEQTVLRQRGKARFIPQLRPRQAPRPRGRRARDISAKGCIVLDKGCGNQAYLAWPRPGLRQCLNQQALQIVNLRNRATIAQELDDQTLGFGRSIAGNRPRERAQCLVRAIQIVQGPRQIVAGLAEIRLERDSPLEPRHGLGELALHRQREAKTVLSFRKIRVDCESALVVRLRFHEPALRQKQVADVQVRLREVWIERQGLLEMGECLVELALCQERDAKVVVGLDCVRLERERAPITGHRFIGFAPLRQHACQIEMRFDAFGFELDGAPEMLDGIVQSTEDALRQREPGVPIGFAVVQFKRRSISLDRHDGPIGLHTEQAEIVPCADVFRVARENSAIERFGLAR